MNRRATTCRASKRASMARTSTSSTHRPSPSAQSPPVIAGCFCLHARVALQVVIDSEVQRRVRPVELEVQHVRIAGRWEEGRPLIVAYFAPGGCPRPPGFLPSFARAEAARVHGRAPRAAEAECLAMLALARSAFAKRSPKETLAARKALEKKVFDLGSNKGSLVASRALPGAAPFLGHSSAGSL